MSPEIDKLSAAISSFTELIHALPQHKLESSRTEKWGAREVLIHLVFWHEQYAQIASDVLANRDYKQLRGTFKEINAFAVKQNVSVPINELLERWAATRNNLERLSKKPGSSRIKFCLRVGSKQWPFFVLMRLSAGHIRQHEEKLRKLLGIRKRRPLAAA